MSNKGAGKSETFAGGISNGGTISSGVLGIVATNITQFGATQNGGFTNTGTIKDTGTALTDWAIEVSASNFAGSISNSGIFPPTEAIDLSVGSSSGSGFTNTGSISGTISVGAGEVYDISSNAITTGASLGQVGLEWAVSGFGDFSTKPGETDMLMRDSNNRSFMDVLRSTISATTRLRLPARWAESGLSGPWRDLAFFQPPR